MRGIWSFIFILFFAAGFYSQVFWTENFNTGAGWTLANVMGAEGSDPNFFQITPNEGGNITPNSGAPTSCGVANNGNNSMHVTSVFFPGGGAAYDAGGLCGFLFCPQTNRRAQSPVINCSGQTGITLRFNYIEGGQGTTDNATCWYFDGSAWAQIDDMPKTATGCGGQGLWITRTLTLPASANNNANVRLGFRWVNNDDGVGTDPSFAVDNMSLSVAALPVELISFTAGSGQAGIILDWTYINEGGMKGYAVERSDNGIAFEEITFIHENSLAGSLQKKEFIDGTAETGVNYYYRLRCVEKDGSDKYSALVTARREPRLQDIKVQFGNGQLTLEGLSGSNTVLAEIIEAQGKVALSRAFHVDQGPLKWNVDGLDAGIYFCRLSSKGECVTVMLPLW